MGSLGVTCKNHCILQALCDQPINYAQEAVVKVESCLFLGVIRKRRFHTISQGLLYAWHGQYYMEDPLSSRDEVKSVVSAIQDCDLPRN